MNLDAKYLLVGRRRCENSHPISELCLRVVQEQTKPCPVCGVRTKKDGGCMYIVCTQW